MAIGETVTERRTIRAPLARSVTVAPAAPASSGRPVEIEDWSNRRIVHPLSRALVSALIPTGISPNAVSVLGVAMAAAASASYTLMAWPVCAFVGFGFHIAWHVFDGADGDLARRTGRSSTMGELVDGVCDYLSHAVLYLGLALFLAHRMGAWGLWAWPITALAAASNAWQANFYESGRRNYWRWVYGANWIKQELAAEASRSPSAGRRFLIALGRIYLAASAKVTADEHPVEAVMGRLLASGPAPAEAARELYREAKIGSIKRSSWLGENHKTMVLFVSMLFGTPLWYLLYVGVALNAVLMLTIRQQMAGNARLTAKLESLEAELAEEAPRRAAAG
jgi:phosphatidylglycerophosphate synthase